MERHLLSFRLTIAAASLVLAGAGFAASAAAGDGVVLFAPGEYAHRGDGSFHARAAEQMHQRLLKAGIPEDRMAGLRGKEATAQAFRDALAEMTDTTGPEDLLLVVICSHGVHFDDRDYVLAADTPANPGQETSKANGRIIAIPDVLQEMAVSASNRRLLIVDGAAESDPSLADATVRFGRLPLQTADGQWVILNRANRLSRRGDQPPLTDFFWSLLDGITLHADGNRDGSVSLLELADYAKLYAEEQHNPVPRIAGKTTGDIALLPTSAADDGTFPREALAANARRLVAEARKTLLLEADVRAGLALLDRARRLCDDPDLTRQIDEVSVTAGILNGEADRVLPLAEDAGPTYAAVLPRDAGVYASGAAKASQPLPAGTVVEITNRVPITSNGRTWTYVCVVALSPEHIATVGGELALVPVPAARKKGAILLGYADPGKVSRVARAKHDRTEIVGIEQDEDFAFGGQPQAGNHLRGQFRGFPVKHGRFATLGRLLAERRRSPQTQCVGDHHATVDQYAGDDRVPWSVDLLGVKEQLLQRIHPLAAFAFLRVVDQCIEFVPATPAQFAQRVHRLFPQQPRRIPSVLVEKMADRLPRSPPAIRLHQRAEIAPSTQDGPHHHDPPDMFEVFGTERRTNRVEEPLATARLGEYLRQHRVFPPWPGALPGSLAPYHHGRKGPFS